MNKKGLLKDIETYFITYDEPLKDQSWEKIKQLHLEARRIDSIKGFDRAHKLCAEKTQGERFISIDGDNELMDSFFYMEVSEELLNSEYVLSWGALNSVNGLCYGNGGIKCWPKTVVENMSCHENAVDEKSAVDFCYQVQYYLMPEILSVSNIHNTPYQAFRSGFREGIKMSLVKGEKVRAEINELSKVFGNSIPKSNMERLKIWCTIGADITNGLWAIYGARLGLYYLYIQDSPLEKIRDYDWFNNFWQNEIAPSVAGGSEVCNIMNYSWDPQKLKDLSIRVMSDLNDKLKLGVCEFNTEQSRFFKAAYKNRERKGLMR